MKAVIFDMNGVIIDDERFHAQSWIEFSKKYNLAGFSEDFRGKRDKDIFEYLFKRQITPQELQKYADERREIVISLEKGEQQLAVGLHDLLDELQRVGIPMAVATSSLKIYADSVMGMFHIRDYFSAIVTAEDVERGKPDPEVYLKTAGLLSVSPADCVVFEDSLAGITAAHAAGMKVIGITTTNTREALSQANLVIDTFTEITVQKLQQL